MLLVKIYQRILFFSVLLITQVIYSQKLEPARYSIKNLKVNTPYTDMSPSFWGKGRLLYSSSKADKGAVKRIEKAGKAGKKVFLKTYIGYITEDYEIVHSKMVRTEFPTKYNVSTVSFSSDLKWVYFTQNDFSKGRNTKRLKIFRAKVDKTGKWYDVEDLSINSERYNTAHPAISDDGTKLYFSSDRPGGYGKADLYVADIFPDGTLSSPRNLGPNINSPGRDAFPDYNNGLLYFSSDRKGGLGGLDIYMFVATDLFNEPTNLGPPINSKYDDFSFVINRKFRKGFFTSNRPQGQGADDIYSFVQEDAIKSCSQTIDGVVLTPDNVPVPKATVNIFNDKGEWLNRFISNKNGRFVIELHKCGSNYKLEALKKHWSKDYVDVKYEEGKKIHKVKLYIDKLSKEEINPNEPKELDVPEGDLFADVKTIEFELNKYYISEQSAEELDKVVKIMKQYPTIIVEFSAHTDSRGPDDFNLELTEQRAAEVVRYITRRGIDHNRIYGKGYGELFPVNHCVNGVKCTEKQHLENRRTEFVILAK